MLKPVSLSGSVATRELRAEIESKRAGVPAVSAKADVEQSLFEPTSSALPAVTPVSPAGRGSVSLGPAVLGHGSLVERHLTLVDLLVSATKKSDALRGELEHGLESRPGRPDAFRWFEETRDALSASLDEVASLRATYAQSYQLTSAAIESLGAQKKQLLESLERVKDTAARDPLTGADPRARVTLIGEQFVEVERQLKYAEEAFKALDVPVPGSFLDQTYGVLSASGSAGVPGWWSLYADIGVRISEKTFLSDHELFPVVSTGLDTSFFDIGYTATTEKDSSGLSMGMSLVPLVSMGRTPRGRFVSVDIPGFTGVGMNERGEVSFNLTLPIGPSVGLGFDFKVGNPAVRGVTSAVLGKIDSATMSVAEWSAGVRQWLSMRINGDQRE